MGRTFLSVICSGCGLENDVALVIDGDFAGLAVLLGDAPPHAVVVLLQRADVGGAVGHGAILGLAFGEAIGALQRRAGIGLGRREDVGLAGIHEGSLVDLAAGRQLRLAHPHRRGVAHGFGIGEYAILVDVGLGPH